MKTIKRYSIENENGIKMASFLDKRDAELWLIKARVGKLGWRGERFEIKLHEVEIAENARTLRF